MLVEGLLSEKNEMSLGQILAVSWTELVLKIDFSYLSTKTYV